MSDKCTADCAGHGDSDRLVKLGRARRLLAAALKTLDAHARSPAAAMVDMAIHHLDRELQD